MWAAPQAAPTAAPSAGGESLHQKFAAAGDSFTFKYGTVSEFFAGLEGMIGSPSADVMRAMERDHASNLKLVSHQSESDWGET